MKKRLIKNLSVLLCAAMLVGSLGYGAAAEPQESEIFEEQGDETSSETSGVSTEPEKGAEAESKDTGDLSDEDGIVETGEEGKKTLDTSEETGEPNEKGDEVKSVEDVVTGDESGENSDSTEEAEGAEGAMTMKLMSGARPMLFKSNRTAPEGYYYSVDPNDPYVYKEDELDNEKSFYYTGDFREPTFYAFRTYSRYSLENLNERDSKSDYYIGELITDASTGETCVSLLEPKADGSPYELGDFDPSDYERYGIVALTEQEVKERRFNIATNQWDYSYYEYLSTETCTLDKCTIEYDLFDAYDKNGIYLGKAMGKVIPYLWSYRNVKVLRYFTFSGFIADEFLADMEAMDVNEFAAKHHSVLENYVKTSVDPTEYGYESLNDEYCAKELPGETLTLYGEDYKITFSKVYNVIKKVDLLAPGVVVPAVKIDDEGDFENVYGYVSVSFLKGKLFPQLPAILAKLKAMYKLDEATLIPLLFSEDAAYEAFAKITNPEVDDSYTHVEAKNEDEDDIEAYYKETGSAQFDFKDGYIELPLFSGYWRYKSTGSNWTKFDDMSLALPKTGGDELFIICNRDYLMSQFGSNFAYICSMDDAVSEEYGITLEEFLKDMLGFIGIEIVRQSLVPTGDDIIKIDEKSYYKLKNDDGLFKQFSDGELYGPVYTKFTLGSNKKFIEDPSMLYLVMGDDEGIVTQSIPDSITGSYADACKQYGDLEQLFGCRFVKKSTPTPTPNPKDDDEKDEPAKEASGQDKGPAPVENSSQMKGTGSQAGWKSIEAAISPKNEVNGTYTIWGSKTMDVPNYVMSKMQNTGVHIANFAMTPKTMFSMWPSLNREGFTLSIDARCWNDNLKYHDFAPSVPAATILAKGGNVLSDVLTVRCSNKDVSKIAVITNNKLLTNAVSATLYVYNPGNNTLVPYKTARYGQNMSVQFVVPCVSATYVCIEN